MNRFSNLKYVLPLLSASLLFGLTACNKAADSTTPNASTTIGVEIDDSVITTRVKAALMADDAIKSMDVKIETRKGEVLLSGFADSQAQIDRSATLVMTVQGVKKVDNKLVLKQGVQTVGNKIDDSVITAGVKAEMINDVNMKSMDVSVVTRKGEVQLSGFVDNEKQAALAVELAKRVQGVNGVVNNLTVKK